MCFSVDLRTSKSFRLILRFSLHKVFNLHKRVLRSTWVIFSHWKGKSFRMKKILFIISIMKTFTRFLLFVKPEPANRANWSRVSGIALHTLESSSVLSFKSPQPVESWKICIEQIRRFEVYRNVKQETWGAREVVHKHRIASNLRLRTWLKLFSQIIDVYETLTPCTISHRNYSENLFLCKIENFSPWLLHFRSCYEEFHQQNATNFESLSCSEILREPKVCTLTAEATKSSQEEGKVFLINRWKTLNAVFAATC